MNLNITHKNNEPLLSRTEVKASMEFDSATPSYADITKAIASGMKTDEKLVAIRTVNNHFGSKTADVLAYVYSDEAKKQLIEPKVKAKKAVAEAK
jgi:ribosomal protein S24E